MRSVVYCSLLAVVIIPGAHCTELPISVVEQERSCLQSLTESWRAGETKYPRQIYASSKSAAAVFGMKGSEVQIWDPLNILKMRGGFLWRSNGKPFGVDEVVAFQSLDGVSVSSAARPGDRAQIIYRLEARLSENNFGNVARIDWTDPKDYSYKKSIISATWNETVSSFIGCVDIVVSSN